MTENLSLNTANESIPPEAQPASRGKVYFDVSPQDWIWNLIFMFSLSLTGLRMPLGNLMVVILLIRAFKYNREAFVVMLTMTCGGFAFSQSNINWGVNFLFLMVPAAILSMCLLRKTVPLKRSIIVYAIFAVITVVMSVLWGVEGVSDQLRSMLGYLSFCFFAIVVLAFSGVGFDIHKFWNTLFSIMMIACAFYILDGFVFRGWVLVPCSWIDFEGTYSSWTSLLMSGPTGWIPRKYPPGLYPLALLVYPLAKYYKMRWWQWVLLIGAMCASRTSTVLFSLVFGFILAQGSMKRYLGYGVVAIVLFAGLYAVDASMGYNPDNNQSTLRIASTIDQFTDLSEAEDEEDVSEAGTGRMAQALPALEHIFEVGREWVGFGFVNNNTEHPQLVLENEYIAALNPELRFRSVTDVEITQVREFLTFGFIGLAVWFGFIFGICRILRGMRFSGYYTNVAIIIMLYGIGGFDSWFTYLGILLGALAYSAVLLSNKPRSLEEYPGEGIPDSANS